jgi:DNA-binding transcriptional LysR family regulator
MAGSGGVDFNLLVPLRALLQERSVTRAAEVAAMSQSSMSAALGRLRIHYGDELLRRTGRTYALTPLAQELLPQLVETLDAVAAALDPWSGFSPATSTRRFTVSGSDHALAVLVEPLLAVTARQALGVSIDFDPLPLAGNDMILHLMRRDLVLGAVENDLPGRRQTLFADRFVCVVASDNPVLRDGRLELADLAALPHAAVGTGAPQTDPVDGVLTRAGVGRRVEVTVQNLLALPFVVSGTDLCAFVPERLLRRCPPSLDLAIATVPLDPVCVTEAAHWHPSRQADPGVGWLRGALQQVSAGLGDAGG